jgi:hypothetical protein
MAKHFRGRVDVPFARATPQRHLVRPNARTALGIDLRHQNERTDKIYQFEHLPKCFRLRRRPRQRSAAACARAQRCRVELKYRNVRHCQTCTLRAPAECGGARFARSAAPDRARQCVFPRAATFLRVSVAIDLFNQTLAVLDHMFAIDNQALCVRDSSDATRRPNHTRFWPFGPESAAFLALPELLLATVPAGPCRLAPCSAHSRADARATRALSDCAPHTTVSRHHHHHYEHASSSSSSSTWQRPASR